MDKGVFVLVEQGLVGDAGVFDIILFRNKGKDGVLQGGLAGGASRLDQYGKRVFELPGDGGKIAGELVGLLAGDADGFQVGQDFIEDGGVLQEAQGLFPFLFSRFRRLALLLLRLPPLDQDEQPADVLLYQLIR